METFRSNLSLLSQSHDSPSSSLERRLWTECLLCHLCLLSSELSASGRSEINVESTIATFRSWAKFWETRPGQGLGALRGNCVAVGVPRRLVWKTYYSALSEILQGGLPYPPPRTSVEGSPSASVENFHARLQQRAELQHVQNTYESLMLEEVKFPKADEMNEEIEEWVELVIGNWRVLCGSTWRDDDLGEGGKEGVARSVLEILYRAAAKSFHSTSILRHLFTVHASLAEFSLAVRAFDSYLELITKAKARVERPGEAEATLDDDETILRTAYEGIRMLCRFGGRPESERANQVSAFVESWLGEYEAENQHPPDSDGEPTAKGGLGVKSVVSPQGIATAYRAIGISKSHWARLTFDASSRAEIQANAAKDLRKSLAPECGDTDSQESLFALGLLLAEMRDISGAIKVVKQALLPSTDSANPTVVHSDSLDDNCPSPSDGHFIKERGLIPFWHLLALLLSVRQDFATAAKSCEAAFEQFSDPVNLFGRDDPNITFPSDRWLALDEKFGRKRARGVVDDMELFEREGVLQVKMTQLALVEVSEGPEIAVNASNELLGLYQRLFGDQGVIGSKAPATPPQPPKSSSGTIRSIGGVLFNRQRSLRRNVLAETNPHSTATISTTVTSRPQTMASQAPKIQVTDEDGGAKGKGHRHTTHRENAHFNHAGEKLHKRHRSLTSLRKRKIEKPESNPKSNNTAEKQTPRDQKDNEQLQASDPEQLDLHPDSYHGVEGQIPPSPSQVGLAVSPDIPSPAPSITTDRSPQQSALDGSYRPRSPEPGDSPLHPSQGFHLSGTRFLPQRHPILRRDDRRRQSIKVLIKVWLLIAGLYRRASMYDDAKEAIDEAVKLVDGLEMEISKDASSSKAFGDPGWEGGKSVEELRGDVSTEASLFLGYLSLAQSSHYEALSHFEQAVSYFHDHPLATVGLANILLDISSQALQPLPSMPSLMSPSPTPVTSSTAATPPIRDPAVTHTHSRSHPSTHSTTNKVIAPPLGIPNSKNPPDTPNSQIAGGTNKHHQPPAQLDLLAARDRAYGLLSSLTKLGTGWNFSEAWMALAKAYEERGQVEKAKEALWWCVELEEGRAIRAWSVVNAGGVVL
ncbi:MAG: hypothetical protein M1839_007687 [Geoglossum umbratile]|nr:MAG: hypothetical protein M1839_007687 [Geoglossum umbratile]